jgi:predicted MFS family arabinose efflux permease
MLFVVSATGHLDPLFALSCVAFLGACNAFSLPSRFSYIALLTPRCCYARAVALNSLAGNAALFVGPVLGCKLMSSMGINAAFAGNAASYIPIIFTVMVAQPNKSCLVLTNESVGMLRQASDGFRFAMRNGEVRNLLLSFAALAVTARAVITFAPSIAASTLHGDIEVLSALTATLAFGAVTGGLCMTKWGLWPVRAMLIVTLGGGAASLLAYGSTTEISVALVGSMFLGFMLSVNNIAVTSAIQLTTPPQCRGRVNSLYNIIFKGGPAAGAAAFGALTQFVDVRGANVLVALTLVFMMIWILRRLNDGGTERSAGP